MGGKGKAEGQVMKRIRREGQIKKEGIQRSPPGFGQAEKTRMGKLQRGYVHLEGGCRGGEEGLFDPHGAKWGHRKRNTRRRVNKREIITISDC